MALTRIDVFKALKDVLTPDLHTIVTVLKASGHVSLQGDPQTVLRQLVEWADSPTGCGLDAIRSTAEELDLRLPWPPSPATSPQPKTPGASAAPPAGGEGFNNALRSRLIEDLARVTSDELALLASRLDPRHRGTEPANSNAVADLLLASSFLDILRVIDKDTTQREPGQRGLSKGTALAITNVMVLTVVRSDVLAHFRAKLTVDGMGRPSSPHNPLAAGHDAMFEWIVKGSLSGSARHIAATHADELRGARHLKVRAPVEIGPDTDAQVASICKEIAAPLALNDSSDESRVRDRLRFFFDRGDPVYTDIPQADYERFHMDQLARHFPHLLIFVRPSADPGTDLCTSDEGLIIEYIHHLLLAPPDVPKPKT